MSREIISTIPQRPPCWAISSSIANQAEKRSPC
jgi:hypothetical protein